MRLALGVLILALAAAAQAAPARLTDAEVRAFVDRQSRAWNAGDVAGYFATFTPRATFTDQGRAKDGRVAPYGTSTLAEARAQARSSFASSKVHETTAVKSVRIAPDGRSAQVTTAEQTIIATRTRTRRICGERSQTLTLTPAGLRSTGQVETIFACR